MNEQNKKILLFIGIISFIILLNTGLLFIIPFFILLSFGVYKILQKKNQNFINVKSTNTMNTYSISNVLQQTKKAGVLVFAFILGIILLANMIVIIPAGKTGVYHLFGKVRDNEVSSGIHLINPLASIVPMSIRTEQYTMSIAKNEGQKIGDDSIEALTKEGLKVYLDMTVFYHLKEESASDVYRELGTNYDEKILRPEVRTAIRDVIALYEAKDVYSEKREDVVKKIQEKLSNSLGKRGIILESVLLRNVALPAMLTSAIENKLTAEQEAQRYEFLLQKEEKEAERKRIEAGGQRDAQTIINQSLTDRYLQYLYIQNLENREGTIYVPYDLPLLKGL